MYHVKELSCLAHYRKQSRETMPQRKGQGPDTDPRSHLLVTQKHPKCGSQTNKVDTLQCICHIHLEEKETRRKHFIPADFKISWKSVIFNIARYLHKYRHIDQQNKTESLDINLCIYSKLIVNKDPKRKTIFTINGPEKIGCPYREKQ